MRIALVSAVVLSIGTASSHVLAQSPPAGPTFEVVSIKRNVAIPVAGSPFTERPDGGFTMTNQPVTTLIRRAYPTSVAADVSGWPDWAISERFDVTATSSLTQPSAVARTAMLRAMLADRFRLVAHIEQREQQVYDLVLARSDGRLGPGLKKYEEDVDCEARLAAQRAAAAAGKPDGRPRSPSDLNASPPPCAIYTRGPQGNQMEGKIAIYGLAQFLQGAAGRPIVDRTGLEGMYHVTMEFDRLAGIRGPALSDTPGAAPSVFVAVQEQLGLKLEPSRAMRDMLVIDRLERPTEN